MKSERKKHSGFRRASVIVLSTAMILTMSAMNVFAGDQDGSGDLGVDRNDPPIWNGEHIDGDWVGTLEKPGADQPDTKYVAAINAVNGTDPEVTGTVRAIVPDYYESAYGVMVGNGTATVGEYLIAEKSSGASGAGIGIGVDPTNPANGSVSVGYNISAGRIGVELNGAENSAVDVNVGYDIYAGDVGVIVNGKKGTVYNVTAGKDIQATSRSRESMGIQIVANQGSVNIKANNVNGSGDGILVNNNQGDVTLGMYGIGSEYKSGLHVVNNSGNITSYTKRISAAEYGIRVSGSDNGTLKIVNTDTIFGVESGVWVDLASEDGALPDITAKEFFAPNSVAKVTVNGTFNQKLTDKLLDSIHYIIDSDASLSGVKLSGDDLGTVTIQSDSVNEPAKTYHTLTRGAHVLTISVPAGKTLRASSNASIVRNGNGTYTLTINDGGKVTLSTVEESKDSSDANKGNSSAASAGAGKFARSAKYSRIAVSGKKVVRDVNVAPTSADESADTQAEKATTSKAKTSGTAKAAASQEASSDNGSSKMVMIVVAAIALAGLAYFLFGRRKREDEQQ